LKEAVDHYRKTLELKPGLYQVHKGLASALLRLGRTDEAVTQYEKVLKLKPGLVRVRNRLAQILQGLGRFEKAITHYEEAVRLRPDYAAAHSNLARLRAVCSDPKYRDAPKALIGAKRACELSGWKHFGPLDTLASAYAAAGKFDEAVKWQTKAVELAPEGAKADLRSRLKLYAAKKPYRDTPKK
jgi:tetratricopeptide (TPR) repeat protein